MKNYKKSLLFLVLSLLTLTVTFAQSKDEKKLAKLGKDLVQVEEYNQALQVFDSLMSYNAENPEYNYYLGVCYYHSEHQAKSIGYLKKAEKLGFTSLEFPFYAGRGHHLASEFGKAIEYYNMFKSYALDPKSSEWKTLSNNYEVFVESGIYRKYGEKVEEHELVQKQMERYIQMCETGKKLVETPVEVTIDNVGGTINSQYPDYVPVISADETVLVFTSRRPPNPNKPEEGIDLADGQYYEDIYECILNEEDSTWSDPVKIANINTEDHDACIGLSADGQKLFLYRSDRSNSKGWGDIYVSELDSNTWSVPEKMQQGINTPEWWEPSASITADEQTLFFTSNREGGYGGTDIYMAKRLPDGSWAKPKNLGPTINTPFDDDGPFIHPDGKTLYFSSKGHETMGGFDIFTSVYDESTKKWSKPQNEGYPINTPGNDIFFVWSADGERAYFSSERGDGHGEKDIYVLHRPEAKVNLIVLKGKVMAKDTKHAIGATITITDLETNQTIGVYNSNSYTGKYTVILPPGKNYGIFVEAKGYLTHSEHIYIPDQDDFVEFKKDVELEPLVIGSVSVLKNVFFDFDKATLRPESHIELDKYVSTLTENPTLYVEVGGHTDSKGNDDYNKRLSNDRAKAVVEYLVSKGIERERLIPIGYGEEFPIATNDTEAGRQLNRRTELIIIDILEKGGVHKIGKGYYYEKRDKEGGK